MKNGIRALLLFLLLTNFSCNFGNSSDRLKNPEELKLELKLSEQSSPMQYLSLDSVHMKRNKIKEAGLFSNAKYDGYKITGIVINSASIARYKDLVITVEIYSKTNTKISSEDYVFYEYYEPNSGKDFWIKLNPSDAMDSFQTNVTRATATE